MTKGSNRVYLDAELALGTRVTLSKAASHHLCNVLRHKSGDSLIVFNGDGADYQASIASTGKQASINIHATTPNSSESRLHIHLLQGISRGDRMDTTIQKAVELGVHRITPLITDKSQVKLTPERLAKKISHWKNIVIGACEQSGRSVLPDLNPPVPITDLLSEQKAQDNQTSMVLDPRATAPIGIAQLESEYCRILVGPESGLTEAEITSCLENGFNGFSLGPRVLRTETAGPATIAILQARFGDLS